MLKPCTSESTTSVVNRRINRQFLTGNPVFSVSAGRKRVPYSGLFEKRVVACSSGDYQRKHSTESALNGGIGREEDIGSEYGEGFVNYKIRDGVDSIDVDALNMKLRTQGAQRLRHAMKPDEAIGVLFSFDGVIADTRSLKEGAWKMVAQEEGYQFPSIPRPQIYELPPERALTEVLLWTRDWAKVRQLSYRVSEAYAELFSHLDTPKEGVLDWLIALEKSKVPCALISNMDRGSVKGALKRMGLDEHFVALVSFEDGMETIAQRFLSGAIKLSRPPNSCVIFDATPKGIAAAHNCTMKSVAVQGEHKAYELKQADLTCSSMNELSVYNLRRLFANRGWEFMDHAKQKDTSYLTKKASQIAAGTL